MNIQKIIQIFNEKHEVHFKIMSLEYTISNDNDEVVVYADLYDNRKLKYKNIEDAINNFTIYNEPISFFEDRIEKIS